MREGTLVYVHGAGDRVGTDPTTGVLTHGDLIRDRLRELAREFEVVVCTWGDAHGSSLEGMPPTMPGVDAALTAGPGWEQLQQDPYLPIRRLTEGPGRSAGPTGSEAVATIAEGLLLLWQERGLGTDARVGGLDPVQVRTAVSGAAQEVRSSEEFAGARGVVDDLVGLVRGAAQTVAALAASTLLGSDADPGRFAQVASGIGAQLGFLDMAALIIVIADTLLGEGRIPGPLDLIATDELRQARRDFMSTGIIGIADILLYQRNGQAIRDFVGAALHGARQDEDQRRAAGTSMGRVVALGNSLGGIVLADTLAERASGDCDVFVTMGSQPGALKVLGALGPDASARPFRPWVNIYDPRDFMAFLAAPVWPDLDRIEDIQVDLGRGFPHSHGKSYYEPGSPAIREMLAALDRLF